MNAMTIKQTVIERAQARSAALVRGDVAALNSILAGEFIYINARGEALDKSTYLQRYVTSGAVRFLAQTMDAVRVQLCGEAAILTCRVHDRFEYQRQIVEADYRSLFVYVRQGTQWCCVAGQTTAIAEE